MYVYRRPFNYNYPRRQWIGTLPAVVVAATAIAPPVGGQVI